MHAAIIMNRIKNKAVLNLTKDSWRQLFGSPALQEPGNTSPEQTHTHASGQANSSASEQTRDSASEQRNSSGVVQTENQAGYESQPAEADEDAPSN